MEISRIYIVDSKYPSSFSISGDGELISDILQEYCGVFSHVPFVHHEYTDYWEQGIPIIHVTNNIKVRDDYAEEIPGKYLTVFLPQSISYENAEKLLDKLDEFKDNSIAGRYYKNLVYVKDKTTFGYDYECYPPLYKNNNKVSFKEAIQMFLRDSFHQSTDEEVQMFHDFRTFDIRKMLTDDSIYSFPINHGCCGVLLVNREGERYSSTVTKNAHQETLNYLLSCMCNCDVAAEEMSLPQKVINFSSAVLLFNEGEIYSFLPEKISKKQHDELLNIADEIDQIDFDSDIYFGAARVLSDGNVVDEDFSFRDNVSRSYFELQKESRGKVLNKNTY